MSARLPRVAALDMPLLRFSEKDSFTLRHACEGTIIFGQSGSGKTTGPGDSLRTSFLRAGCGFCVFPAKPGEAEEWATAAKANGRGSDVRVFGPGQPYRLNALDYLYRAPGSRGGSMTDNVLAALTGLLQAREGGERGSGTDPFWHDSARMLLGSAIDLLGLANESISFPAIQEVLIGAPGSAEEVRSPDWQAKSYLNRLVDVSTSRTDLTSAQRNDLGVACEYWLNEYPRMDPKTRSGVVATVTSMTYAFRRGMLAELFGEGGEQLTPEDSFAGRILIIDLPVKEFLEVGQFAQVLWKLLWMRAAERRDRATFPRPVVLWADEAQNLVTRYDSLFQATARSAGVATVYLTQNRDSLRSRFKGTSGDAEAESLLGNFNLKVFTCNDHTPTNTWAAGMIGEIWQTRANVNTSLNDNSNLSAGTNEQRRFLVEAIEFMRLKKGGPENNGIVEAIAFRSGRPFAATGHNHITVHFRQGGIEPQPEEKS